MGKLTEQGITALKNGNKQQAKQLLETAIQQDPQDLQAWLWLSGAVDTIQERIRCLQQVLRINPDNEIAARGIAKLIAQNQVSVQAIGNSRSSVTASASTSPLILQSADSVNVQDKAEYRANSMPERTIFTVKPSLAPTLILGGIVTIIGVVIVLVIFGPMVVFFAKYDQPTAPAIFLNVFLITIVSYPLIRKVLKLLFTTYTLTTRHLVMESGIIGRKHKTIPIQKIQDVAYEQSFLERFFGIGDVVVESAGERGAIHLFDLTECQNRTQQILKIAQNSNSQ